MMEAETGVLQPHAKECLGLPEAGRSQEGSIFRGFGGNKALLTPCYLTSSLPNCDRIHFCCSKPPILWYSVTPALGNSALFWGEVVLFTIVSTSALKNHRLGPH